MPVAPSPPVPLMLGWVAGLGMPPVPIGSFHFRLSWFRLLGVASGVLVWPRARRPASTREHDRVPALFTAFVRLNVSVPWHTAKFVQCYERLAPYLACLSVDGRRAYGEREEGLHPVGPGQGAPRSLGEADRRELAAPPGPGGRPGPPSFEDRGPRPRPSRS